MPLLVLFGAGNIGRGFIAPTFSAAGWRVVFVDVDRARIAALRARGAYQVIEVDNHGERKVPVGPVEGIDAGDAAAVAAAVASCDLAATAVGLGALPHLGPGLAAGLVQRLDQGRGALDVLVCENGAQAHAALRAAVLAAAPEARRAQLDAALGAVRTSIGRMIPAGAGADPLDLRVEPYATLPVERGAFRGPVPAIDHLVAAEDFDLVLREKLYLHNLTHACLAYAGHLAGCATIPECMDDAALVEDAAAAGREAGEALGRAHGRDPAQRELIRADCAALVDGLMERYRNRALNDPVARVARDPWRKLAADDRLVGAARLCLQQGVAPTAIVRHIVQACRYAPAPDEPRAAEWNRLRALGPGPLLSSVGGLGAGDPLLAAVLLEHRRQQATRALRSANLALSDAEAARLVIGDFGLGRYEQIGLAIHTYINTARCCANELVMLPGQLCPEHHHPPLPGDPGKEETIRVRQGEIHLFLPGHGDDGRERAFALSLVPPDLRGSITVFRHVLLRPGDQFTLEPGVLHWFVAGKEGAIASEFSTRSFAEADLYTDAEIERLRVPR